MVSIPILGSAGQFYAVNKATSVATGPVFYFTLTSSTKWSPGYTRTYQLRTSMARTLPSGASFTCIPLKWVLNAGVLPG